MRRQAQPAEAVTPRDGLITERRVAAFDARWEARLTAPQPLTFAQADAARDLPGHVRAGSAVRRWGQRLVVVDHDLRVQIVDGQALYAGLRARADFAGSELNVEGAVVVDGALRLFQRGNGAPRAGRSPVNATGDLALAAFVAWLDGGENVPTLTGVVQVDLGTCRGVPFGFTDACALPDGRVAFLAGAEDSPDTFRDGQVLGCRVGIIDGGQVHMTDILDDGGRPTLLKLEGIDWLETRGDGGLVFVVVADMDDPERAAVVARLTIKTG